ncbi:hypothetical protein L3Q65_18290 [Amycolatopsis sp. FU40]|uniref:hypothetical protein n=1 Tax=Amycolatopsis sp. FU40 TaxID=2914159 RepID=UPI001F263E4C|nr:hypothetical protein [Amycolatopsis sp. FU40]UKD58587.1 hypothetical protein L3Q65_18290 [Amycolatopsis sp. FU40]
MATPEYLGQAVLDVSIAPGRVAYLICEGSRDGFRRAVQEACTRWGGQAEPIIPVGAGGTVAEWHQQVVELAGVEAVVNIDLPDDDAATAAQALNQVLIPLAHIDNPPVASSFTVHPSWVENPPNSPDGYIVAAVNAPLWQVAVAGDLTADHLAALNQPGRPFHVPQPFSVYRQEHEDQVSRAQLRGDTLLDRTVAWFGECWARPGPTAFPALIWVTDGDNLEDCQWFWNLRALRPLRLETVPMVLLPADAVEHWMGYANQLSVSLARFEGFAPDVVIGGHTVEDDKLHGLASQLGLQRSNEEARSGYKFPAELREAPFTYLTWNELAASGMDYRIWLTYERRYGEPLQILTQLFRDPTVIRFASPVPFTAYGRALLRLSGGPFDALPQRASTARLVHDAATWHGEALQFNTDARRVEYDLRVRIPRMTDVVSALLQERTQRHELSDKGKIGAALQASRDIAVLLQPGAYEAINELTTPRAKRLREELHELNNEGLTLDAALVEELVSKWGHRGERRYRAGNNILPLARPALETLVDHYWAERGFEIACTTCGVNTFAVMADVPSRGPAVCDGCQAPQRYTTPKTMPAVYYRLDALIDRASDNGVLPHLLAIAALTVQDPECCLLPGTDVVSLDGDTSEVDIFGVHNARVLAGEVKTRAADFTPAQLTRDVNLTKRLDADIHLLAAIDTVPADTAAEAQQLCDEAGLELLVLDKTQLRPVRG